MAKTRKQRFQSKKRSRGSRLLTWMAVVAIAGLAVYGLSQMSSIAYTEKDLSVVNFSALDGKQKRAALEAANRARCNCGCGLGLAQCVSTDLTCPIRESNIDLIKGMVRAAMASPPSS